jgi:hypothetical protein
MIALITPTGGRPKQMRFCAEWMKRQTYTGDVLWVIVDDCRPVTINFIKNDFRSNWEIVKLYPTPVWSEGQNTQSRNLYTAITFIKKQKNITDIFIIEDDDYYVPEYIEVMLNKVDGFDAAAQANTIYFNINNFVTYKNHNTRHGSLFQTVFSYSMLPLFEQAVQTNAKFIDMSFWKIMERENKKLNVFVDEAVYAIGMKGMNGRSGIGVGHTMAGPKHTNRLKALLDLKKLIGTDYLYYA